MPKIAISDDFLEAYSRVPRAQQRKVREFITRFQIDPTQHSINYEAIHGTQDDRVRTVRIGLDYRAIVLHPDQGDVYLLAWVDHHDEAMEWAARKQFAVNPVTGALQVFDTEVVERVRIADGADDRKALPEYGVFETFEDADLLRTGVPEPLLPAIRPIRTAEELEELAPYLPEEAYEALYWIANLGYSVDQALAEAGTGKVSKPVDVRDIGASLENANSRRRYAVVNSADEMAEMLNQPLAKWRVFLHPSQYNLVHRDFSGPARVLGSAGTGKTVVAMHRARHLAAEVFTKPTERILFTTFTRNLAHNIQENLNHLCGPELERIEVANIHHWAMTFLGSQGFDPQIASRDEVDRCWSEAIRVAGSDDYDDSFYVSEWENVVQAQGIKSRAAYLRARRHGQGRPLNRKQRAAVWEVLAEYRNQLDELGKMDWSDVITEARLVLEQKGDILPYKAVVVDETQDLAPEELRLLRQIVPVGANDLFFVGDAHQRIYGRPVAMSQCGIDIRGRSRKLHINYRTTDEIRRWSFAVLKNRPFDDLDGGMDELEECMSLRNGVIPEVRHFESQEEEAAFLVERVTDMVTGDFEAEDICLVARTKWILDKTMSALERAGLPFLYLDKDTPEDSGSGVRLATMHRVKGLEFAHVLVTAVNEGVIPYVYAGGEALDEAELLQERCLLHVAASRARDTLVITSYGRPSGFLA